MYLIRDHYKVLRISHDAKLDEIEAAYQKALKEAASMNRYQAVLASLCGRDIETIQAAYEELIDPQRRARFDKEWSDYPVITPPF